MSNPNDDATRPYCAKVGGRLQQGSRQVSPESLSVFPVALSAPATPVSDLLEHQLKQLLRDVGIPVLPSQLIASAEELKHLQLPYPLVLKSQVQGRQRQQHGGVATVTNAIDAIAVGHRLFDTCIHSEYPEYLLAEAFYAADQHVGLEIQCQEDGHLAGQIWLIAPTQPSEFEIEPGARSSQFSFCQPLSSNIAPLMASLGLPRGVLESLVEVLEKMHTLLEWLNLERLVIEPLALGGDGTVIALDGCIQFKPAVLEQQPQLKSLFSPKPEVQPPVVQLEGNIGILSNSLGLAMATVDSLKQAGGCPAAFTSVKEKQGAVACHPQHASMRRGKRQERMQHALENLARLRDVRLILINWPGLAGSCREVAETIVNYFHLASQHVHLRGSTVPLVVRLSGPEAAAGRSLLREVGIVAVENLDEAIAEGIGLAQVRCSS